jgi:hypothetical protein
MRAMTIDDNAFTRDFETVRQAENAWIAERRVAAGLEEPDGDVVGLAFSGGGIRSATFNLGVLQALEASGVMRHVDYLSSVSGGGYVASCYTWLRACLPKSTARVFEAKLQKESGSVLDWLRAHGKYLISHRGFSMWTLIASVLAASLVNVLVLGPAILFSVYGMTLAWLPAEWPTWLMLPGSSPPADHHGYWMLLSLGALSLLLFPVLAVVFAFIAGIPGVATVKRIDRLRVTMGRLILYGIILLAIGVIPIIGDLGELAEQFFKSTRAHQIGLHFSYLLPILSGIGSMFADKLRGGKGTGRLATLGVSLVVYGILILAYHLAVDTALIDSSAFLLVVVLSVVAAFVCDLNRVSIHAYYRARLSDAFLPPVEGAICPDPGNFGLSQIGPDKGAPLHLINTTLNTTSAHDERERSRQGASFFFSPVYSGSQGTGFRRIGDYAGGALALSTAFTISGAAVDPNTYATNARSVSFLMALLNVRLGFWAKNPDRGGRRNLFLPWWWIFIFREMLGIGLDPQRHHVHLSDGGGFENLGLYELVRRRVRYLVVTDAGADPDTTLSDLGRAIERVRVDFGAQITLCADRLYHERSQALAQHPYVLGKVNYADGSQGDILYIKPVLCAGLSADIYAYWRAHESFPDEPTSEQFFDEPQFEAYRMLGQEIVGQMIGGAVPASVGAWFEQLRAGAVANADASTAPPLRSKTLQVFEQV